MKYSGIKTKIIYIFLFAIFLGMMFNACKKDKTSNIIPDVYVNFSIRLDDPEFINLNAVSTSVLVTSRHADINSAGYDYNGVIVFRASTVDFYSYDATCPYDFDSISVAVEIDGAFTATCPACHSEYNLFHDGYPSKGPSSFPLKSYRAEFDPENKTVYVHN